MDFIDCKIKGNIKKYFFGKLVFTAHFLKVYLSLGGRIQIKNFRSWKFKASNWINEESFKL